jgi:hypothetical protein
MRMRISRRIAQAQRVCESKMLTPHLLGVPKRGDDGGAKGQAASPREGMFYE